MRALRIIAAMLVAAVLIAGAGCKKEAEEPALEPKIAPPAIAKAGVLRAGVDLDYPPFAGTVDGETVGIDVDVAAAIAERLGLELELVDVKPEGLGAALAEGDVDIALAAVPIADAVVSDVAVAGSYLVDGPAIFSMVTTASAEPTPTAASLGGRRVGVQTGTLGYWRLQDDYGSGFATEFETLEQAFAALAAGEIDVVVCDAVVGGYLGRDFPDVRLRGQYGTAAPLGVTVAPEATELEQAVRETLDALAAEGVLDTIRRKWVGELPRLEVPSSEVTATP